MSEAVWYTGDPIPIAPTWVRDWHDGWTKCVTAIERSNDGVFRYLGYDEDREHGLVFPEGRQLERLERIAARLFTDQLSLGS